jgi:hypothetical protein
MEWSRHWPQQPGLYWYRHYGRNGPEPVKVTPTGHVVFIGDWRSHSLPQLAGALWGDRITAPDAEEASAE